MTNIEKAKRLLKAADDIFEVLNKDSSENNWNLVVRRAQEVVELILKGLLTEMGVDYPKVHDVAPVLIEEFREKSISIDEEKAVELERISTNHEPEAVWLKVND